MTCPLFSAHVLGEQIGDSGTSSVQTKRNEATNCSVACEPLPMFQ